jgi:hypothetical protein
VTALGGIAERDDDDVADADGDLLVATRAEVDLRRRIRLDSAQLC